MASARSALAMTLRPVSVIVGLFAGGFVHQVLKLGSGFAIWYTRQPTTGLLSWALSLVALMVAELTGGYVAARLSRSHRMAAASTVGVIDLLLVIVLFASDFLGDRPWWMWAAYLVVYVPAAALGGWLATRSRVESLDDELEEPGEVDPA